MLRGARVPSPYSSCDARLALTASGARVQARAAECPSSDADPQVIGVGVADAFEMIVAETERLLDLYLALQMPPELECLLCVMYRCLAQRDPAMAPGCITPFLWLLILLPAACSAHFFGSRHQVRLSVIATQVRQWCAHDCALATHCSAQTLQHAVNGALYGRKEGPFRKLLNPFVLIATDRIRDYMAHKIVQVRSRTHASKLTHTHSLIDDARGRSGAANLLPLLRRHCQPRRWSSRGSETCAPSCETTISSCQHSLPSPRAPTIQTLLSHRSCIRSCFETNKVKNSAAHFVVRCCCSAVAMLQRGDDASQACDVGTVEAISDSERADVRPRPRRVIKRRSTKAIEPLRVSERAALPLTPEVLMAYRVPLAIASLDWLLYARSQLPMYRVTLEEERGRQKTD